MNIGIVGAGTVGGALAAAFHDKSHTLSVYDKEASRRRSTLTQVLACDLVFVCLPTPQKEGSLECDLSYVHNFFDGVCRVFGGSYKDINWVLKSTVPVGTTRKLRDDFGLVNLVHSPEFLTARTAKEDAAEPRVNIIGIPHTAPLLLKKEYNPIGSDLRKLYAETWPEVPVRILSSDESEFVKLMQNSFSAVKISFFNEMRAFADEVGLNWQACLTAALAQGWIGEMHTQVPGPDGKRGYGGTCLPKDIANLINCMRKQDCFPVVCHAALRRNEDIDRRAI